MEAQTRLQQRSFLIDPKESKDPKGPNLKTLFLEAIANNTPKCRNMGMGTNGRDTISKTILRNVSCLATGTSTIASKHCS